MTGAQGSGGQQAGDDPVSSFSDDKLIHNVARGPQPPPYGWQPSASQGPPPAPDSSWTAPVSSRWPLAIISIFFFWPLGISACVVAAKVKPALRAGDVAAARKASNRV